MAGPRQEGKGSRDRILGVSNLGNRPQLLGQMGAHRVISGSADGFSQQGKGLPLGVRLSVGKIVIVKNEGVPVNDVVLWLKRQCTLLAPLTRVCEDDVWTGGWKTEVELKVVDNVPQHLPNTFFIGKEKCICFYAGQSRRCFKCGSLNHLASSCLVERCAYCGKIGHTKKVCKIIKCNLCGKEGHPHRLCPKAWHNNNGQKGNMAEQEEDQLMFEAVQEVEQQCREELRQKPEAAKANQAQREVPVGDQSSKGRKAQSQEGSSNGQRVDDQRSSPQAGPSQAKKGLSEAPTTPPNAPDPKQQLSISRAASPQQSQEISLSPAPPLQEHPKKRKKKNKKNKRSSEQVDADSPEVGGWQFVKSSGKRSPGVMTFPETSNRYAQLQIEGDDSGEDDSNEDDSWGSIMEEEYQRMEKEVSLEQSAQQSAAFSQSTPRGGGTISADVGCSDASSEVVGPTISQPEVDLVTDVEVIPLGDEDPIPAGVQIKRFGEEVCEEEREG
uniref:CCHC-type domain-containing protein n=1 Tax=Xenopus tropicalis TaxID=8364 RepID=A0A803J652_XENTR